jgi:DNA primase
MIGSQRSFEEKQVAIQAAVPFMARIADPVSRELFIRRVAERVGIGEGLLKKEVSRGVPSSRAEVPVSAASRKPPPLDPLEWSLLQLMLEHPETIPEISRSGILDCFLHEDLKRFGAYLVKQGCEGHGQTPSIQDLLAAWPEDPIRERVQRLSVTASPYDPGMVDKIRVDTIHRIRRRWFRGKHRLLAEALRDAQDRGDQAGSEELLRRKESLLREEQGVDINRSKG